MNRVFSLSQIDSNHRIVTCVVSERPRDCVALFSCLFEGDSIKTFHVDSLRPSSINVGIEYQIFITRALRIVREGLMPDEASLLEL